jgi:Trk K+ transport system NAD-binding subunit
VIIPQGKTLLAAGNSLVVVTEAGSAEQVTTCE